MKARVSLETKAIQPAEVVLALNACLNLTLNSRVNKKWYLYLRVRWETGIRPGEALNIKVDDIFSDKIRIYRFKKTGRPEDFVPIQPNLYQELEQYIKQYKIKGKIFPETIQGATYIWNKIKRKAGLRSCLTLHSFRHGFAYNFLRQAKTLSASDALAQLQRALNHENINTTSQYIRPTFDAISKTIKGMKFK